MMGDYLTAQVEAGVQALQVFDSWAGALGRADYREFALPHTSRIFDALKSTGVPLIHFGVGTAAILGDVAENAADVIGVDWRQPLDEAWAVIGHDRAIQGNLDPTLLLGPRERMLAATDDVLRRAAGRLSASTGGMPLDEAWDRDRPRPRASRETSIRRCCSARTDRLFAATDDVLRRAGGRPGHIFNLGHGVLPNTPLETRAGARAPRA